MKEHVLLNNSLTYSELKEGFPNHLQGSVGVFTKTEVAQQKYEQAGHKRYYINEDEIIKLKDGTNISVSTQWSIGNIHYFIERAKKLGYMISEEAF